MSQANAPLTPVGRARLVSLIIDQGWTIRRAAERFQVGLTPFRRSGGSESRPVARGFGQGELSDHVEQ